MMLGNAVIEEEPEDDTKLLTTRVLEGEQSSNASWSNLYSRSVWASPPYVKSTIHGHTSVM
jgi:hypothetical protein